MIKTDLPICLFLKSIKWTKEMKLHHQNHVLMAIHPLPLLICSLPKVLIFFDAVTQKFKSTSIVSFVNPMITEVMTCLIKYSTQSQHQYYDVQMIMDSNPRKKLWNWDSKITWFNNYDLVYNDALLTNLTYFHVKSKINNFDFSILKNRKSVLYLTVGKATSNIWINLNWEREPLFEYWTTNLVRTLQQQRSEKPWVLIWGRTLDKVDKDGRQIWNWLRYQGFHFLPFNFKISLQSKILRSHFERKLYCFFVPNLTAALAILEVICDEHPRRV